MPVGGGWGVRHTAPAAIPEPGRELMAISGKGVATLAASGLIAVIQWWAERVLFAV